MPVFRVFVIAFAAVYCAGRPALAQTFQVQAKGTISSFTNADHLFDSSIAVGTPFTYTFTFDYSAPDYLYYDSVNGQYELLGAAFGATVTVGDYTVQPSAASLDQLFVEPSAPGNSQYTVLQQTQPEAVFSTNPNAPAVTYAVSTLDLIYKSPSPITSKALPPLSVYNLKLLSKNSFIGPYFGAYNLFAHGFVGPGDPNTYNDTFIGQLTSLTATPSPEPSPVFSLGVGVFCLGARAWRARHRTTRR